MNCTNDASPLIFEVSVIAGAEGEPLHHDRRPEHHQRHPPPARVEERVLGMAVGGVDLVELVVRLVEREQARRR
jgi:hypothetical protein